MKEQQVHKSYKLLQLLKQHFILLPPCSYFCTTKHYNIQLAIKSN